MRIAFFVVGLLLLTACESDMTSRVVAPHMPNETVQNVSNTTLEPAVDPEFAAWLERRQRAREDAEREDDEDEDDDDESKEETDAETVEENPEQARNRPLVYQLENTRFDELKAANAQFIVVDADEADLSREQLDELKRHSIVLAYISMGEAETYRDYWQDSWTTGNPAWLGEQNSRWGSYYVRYWDPAWKAIVKGRLQEIKDAGYSGAFLDTVDTYRYWEQHGVPDAHEKMKTLVRETDNGLLFYANNALDLHEDSSYFSVIDGVGIEELWYHNNALRDASVSSQWEVILDRARNEGKSVLVLEYPTEQEKVCDVYARGASKGYHAYVTTPELDHIVQNPC